MGAGDSGDALESDVVWEVREKYGWKRIGGSGGVLVGHGVRSPEEIDTNVLILYVWNSLRRRLVRVGERYR